mgnify:FL=1
MTNTNIIKDFFEGKIKLWKSFWIAGELIYGFLLLVLLQLDKYLFSELSERSNYLSIFNLNNLSVISKLFLILMTIFISIGVWRAAENYRGSIFIILFVFIYYGYRVSSLVLLF